MVSDFARWVSDGGDPFGECFLVSEGACGGVVCVWPFEVDAWGFALPEVVLFIVDAYYAVLLFLGEVCCGA